MPILNMKPHKIAYLSKSSEYEDANGDFHEGQESWVDVCKCDVVPAGEANTITLPDGTQLQYTYTVYLPKRIRHFATGEKVRISFFENGIQQCQKEFSVKGFHPYQHQCKMWI